MVDVEYLTNEELKKEIVGVIRELQNRNIPFCSLCGETDFFNSDCKECKKTLKKIKI